MRKFSLNLLLSCVFSVLIAFFPGYVAAQGSGNVEEAEGINGEEASEDVDLTEDELHDLLTTVDKFYYDQGIAEAKVDVDVYRDPSGRLNERNIREGDPSKIAGLSTIVAHYHYTWPDFYSLSIWGYVLAGSEVPEDATFYSQVIPMPGAPIYTEDIRERFLIQYEGMSEVDGQDTYKVRYTALDRDNEFFNYLVYYIDTERKVLLRVESSFDNYYYVGSGEGNFYYREIQGRFLPEYAHGEVIFYPNRRYNVWGRWYKWDFRSEEELENEISDESEGGEGAILENDDEQQNASGTGNQE